ncbi:DUF6798 domain-containing protein [Dactylococcopsis salina]|uniref:DUF6798 domain-containing protein n=1 Tax=Dactylococcopsis salina (strain PCC 8305) TaxID=13035 RepID=K9Z0I6_DACS8|nr:DUF6798 domain-containing protein [Dactylococcopsis salina]AFZ52100.1 hypothetical protein Dacsa_3620 [Dactylococcopsis salina PCC 8305]
MRLLARKIDYKFLQAVLITTLFIALGFILEENMGRVNEVDILTFSRQQINPQWLQEDWYYNLPAGYRTPFVLIFGSLATQFGLLFTSIVGRFFGYFLLAIGLTFLAKQIQSTLLTLLLGMTLFLYVKNDQGLVAGEWLTRGIEPKVIAYSFLFIGFGFLLKRFYIWMALFLGLATTFHILVGGWSVLAVIVFLLLRDRSSFAEFPNNVCMGLAYFLATLPAIPHIIKQLTLDVPNTIDVSPSFIYVYLRNPHHLNPLSWSNDWWWELLIYLPIFSLVLVFMSRQRKRLSSQHFDLAILAGTLMIPFWLGLIVSPFDQEGKFLQYYPFRVGDVLFPLITSFLLISALEKGSKGIAKKIFIFLGIAVLTVTCVIQGQDFYETFIELKNFPSNPQSVNQEWKEMCYWIKENTPKDSVFISHPVDGVSFSWLSERGTIAKYKLMPPSSLPVLEWYQRLNDLSGDINPWQTQGKRNLNKDDFATAMSEGYQGLTTKQVDTLMVKYKANYAVTNAQHKLNFPIIHKNSRYLLYQKK